MILSLDYDSPAALRGFLAERGFGMQKKFGQNFLVNGEVRRRLVEALEAPSESIVWEVGPGLGAMTVLLLDAGVRLTAFEIDRGFSAVLRELFDDRPHFSLVEGDVLKTWPARAAVENPRFFFGNLPYNIAATLIASFIEADFNFERAVVTVQKEVAQRMAAKRGDADYSSFSVLIASAYSVRPLLTLKPHSFYPAPNVDSRAVVLERRPFTVPPSAAPFFRPMIRALFASRRKTVRNNLDAYIASLSLPGVPPPRVTDFCAAALGVADIDARARAETLDLNDFARLAAVLGTMIEKERQI